jgi:hypothetical protein
MAGEPTQAPSSPALNDTQLPRYRPFPRCPLLSESYDHLKQVGKGQFGYVAARGRVPSPPPCPPCPSTHNDTQTHRHTLGIEWGGALARGAQVRLQGAMQIQREGGGLEEVYHEARNGRRKSGATDPHLPHPRPSPHFGVQRHCFVPFLCSPASVNGTTRGLRAPCGKTMQAKHGLAKGEGGAGRRRDGRRAGGAETETQNRQCCCGRLS